MDPFCRIKFKNAIRVFEKASQTDNTTQKVEPAGAGAYVTSKEDHKFLVAKEERKKRAQFLAEKQYFFLAAREKREQRAALMAEEHHKFRIAREKREQRAAVLAEQQHAMLLAREEREKCMS